MIILKDVKLLIIILAHTELLVIKYKIQIQMLIQQHYEIVLDLKY